MNDLQQLIYDISRILFWPVLIAAIACLVWVLIELGVLLYELWLRFRYRDLDALEVRALRARKAFRDGKPRTAYRYLQENNYSLVVVRFLYDLIRNYQTERLAAKPLKLLQEYEFYTIKRLERTRVLVRIGPMLGLMGTLIPLSPALVGLATGNIQELSDNLVTAFSVTVIGLLIGGLAFVVSIVRDRMYSQDISDMEYLLELLEGSDVRLRSGRRLSKTGVWDTEAPVDYEVADEDAERTVIAVLPETPDEPLLPVAAGPGSDGGVETAVQSAGPAAAKPARSARTDENAGLTFDDPTMDWSREEDPFANLGPIDPEGTDDPKPRGGGAGPLRRR
jgi:biopolymer transport protein ExbB/TolQ